MVSVAYCLSFRQRDLHMDIVDNNKATHWFLLLYWSPFPHMETRMSHFNIREAIKINHTKGCVFYILFKSLFSLKHITNILKKKGMDHFYYHRNVSIIFKWNALRSVAKLLYPLALTSLYPWNKKIK